jgi:hypothetical protein
MNSVKSRAPENTSATTKASMAKRQGREDNVLLKRESVIL